MNEAQIFSLHLVTSTPLVYRPDFLASLAEQREKGFQILMVDGSNQERHLDPIFPIEVIHLRNFREASYAKGHNQAIAFALQRWPREQWHERFIVLTRPETVFHPACFEAFAQVFAKDPALAIAGPKILLAEAQSSLDQDAMELQLTRTVYEVGYECRKNRHLRFLFAGEEDKNTYPSQEVFGISEPCIVIRASALDALAEGSERWLDESLPRGQELVDLCWRAHQHGLVVKTIPEACVWFLPSELREQTSRRRHVYLSGPVREKNDWISVEFFHLPWVVGSMLRSGIYLLTHPGELAYRIRSWYAWHRNRKPATIQKEKKQVSVAEMRRWFV
jgi:GT2 family glycosyltransferase